MLQLASFICLYDIVGGTYSIASITYVADHSTKIYPFANLVLGTVN